MLPNNNAAEDSHIVQCMAVICGCCIFSFFHKGCIRWAIILFLMTALLHSHRLEEFRKFHHYGLSQVLSTRQKLVGLWRIATEYIKTLKDRNYQVSETDHEAVIKYRREFSFQVYWMHSPHIPDPTIKEINQPTKKLSPPPPYRQNNNNNNTETAVE